MLELIQPWEHRNSCSEFTLSEASVQQRNVAILFTENQVIHVQHTRFLKKKEKKITWTAPDLHLYLVQFMHLPSRCFLPTKNSLLSCLSPLLLERLLTKPIQGCSPSSLVWFGAVIGLTEHESPDYWWFFLFVVFHRSAAHHNPAPS